MKTITIKLDLSKDAWNWWEACNKTSHGVNWREKISNELQEKIVGKNQQTAFDFLIPYLENYYKDKNIEIFIKTLQIEFNNKKNKLFEIMERITANKIYRDDFTCFITSFPRFPYDYKEGYIWLSSKRPADYQLSIFIHELLHFQFFAYYDEDIWSLVTPEQFARIKESVTVILNDEFEEITTVQDDGYEIDRNVRSKLLPEWRKHKNFKELLNFAVKRIKQN